MNKRRIMDLAATHMTLILLIGAMVFPVLVMAGTSLKSYDSLFEWPPRLFPKSPEWKNYVTVWSGQYRFYIPFKNSIVIAGATGIISILLGAPAAYGISRISSFWRNIFLFGVLASQMISPVVFILPLYRMIRAYGLLNTLTSVIVSSAAFTLPMVVWLLHGYFGSIPRELEEAAMVDGCNRLQALYKIMLPLAAPGLAAAGTYAFIMGWDQLMFPLTFLTNSALKPITLALYDFSGYNIVYWHEMMAASTIAVVPVALAFAFIQRYLVKGLTAGAIK